MGDVHLGRVTVHDVDNNNRFDPSCDSLAVDNHRYDPSNQSDQDILRSTLYTTNPTTIRDLSSASSYVRLSEIAQTMSASGAHPSALHELHNRAEVLVERAGISLQGMNQHFFTLYRQTMPTWRTPTISQQTLTSARMLFNLAEQALNSGDYQEVDSLLAGVDLRLIPPVDRHDITEKQNDLYNRYLVVRAQGRLEAAERATPAQFNSWDDLCGNMLSWLSRGQDDIERLSPQSLNDYQKRVSQVRARLLPHFVIEGIQERNRELLRYSGVGRDIPRDPRYLGTSCQIDILEHLVRDAFEVRNQINQREFRTVAMHIIQRYRAKLRPNSLEKERLNAMEQILNQFH